MLAGRQSASDPTEIRFPIGAVNWRTAAGAGRPASIAACACLFSFTHACACLANLMECAMPVCVVAACLLLLLTACCALGLNLKWPCY
jgi:hypothetical protein